MRGGISLALGMGVAALLGVDAALATIIDTGEVAILGGGLEIGQTGTGLRVIDGEADSVYVGVTLGIGIDASGELRLQNAAEFSTTGTLRVGVAGSGLVHVSGGSALESGTAQIGVGPGGFAGTTFAIVEGSGSSWVNAGLLTMGNGGINAGNEMRLSDGASFSTVGAEVLASTFWPSFTSYAITIEGAGTSWSNQGPLSMFGLLHYSVRDGAQAEDAEVDIDALFYGPGRFIVDGPGSLWKTGPLDMTLHSEDPSSGLFVTNGGRLESESAFLLSRSSQLVRIDGAGSVWSVAERLSMSGAGAGGSNTLKLSNGGLLETGGATVFTAGGSGSVLLSGPGSRWENAGSLEFGGIDRGLLQIDAGAHVRTGDATFSCLPCELVVLGTGSAFVGTGSLTLGGDGSGSVAPGVLRVGDQASADVAGIVHALAAGTIRLEGGTLTAPVVKLKGGLLEGRGQIAGDLANAGRIAPGVSGALSVSGDYEQKSAGTLSILLSGAGGVSLLDVLGISVLAGELDVQLAAGYAPQLGDAFEVLRYGQRSGMFESYAGLDLGGVFLVPEYGPTSLVLRAVPEPESAALVALGLLVLAVRSRRRA